MTQDEFEDLVSDLIKESADVAACYEWGIGASTAESYVRKDRDAVLAEHAALLAKVDMLNSILEHIGQELNIDIDPDVLDGRLAEIKALMAEEG